MLPVDGQELVLLPADQDLIDAHPGAPDQRRQIALRQPKWDAGTRRREWLRHTPHPAPELIGESPGDVQRRQGGDVGVRAAQPPGDMPARL